MKLKLILADSAYFFWNNLPQIAILCLPWLMAGTLVEYLISTSPADPEGQPIFIWAIAFNLAVLPIYTAALVLLMARQADNQRPGNKELVIGAFKVWQPLFFLYVLQGALIAMVAVMALSISFMMGSALTGAPVNTLFSLALVFPVVVYIMSRLAFAKFYLVLDGISPMEAIQKSFQATRPHIRTILYIMSIYILPLLTVMYLSTGLPDNNLGHAIGAVISTTVSFLMLFIDVLLFRAYMEVIQNN